MAVKPGVDFRPVSGLPRMSRWDIVCIHTIVGYAPASAAHFSTRWDGYQFQNRDTIYQSAANLNGNHRVLAIENEDHGSAYGSWNTSDGHAVPAFTGAQCESIADILAWCYHTHGIPLELVADSQSSRRGIAYHRQGIKGNWAGYAYHGWTAGEVWSSSSGKVCPGDRRIKQLIEVIIPRARVLAGLDRDDMELGEPSWVPIPGSNPKAYYANGEIQYWDNFYANEISLAMKDVKNMLKALADQGAANAAAIAALTQKVVAGEDADITMEEMTRLLQESVVHVEIKPMTPPEEVAKHVQAIRLDKARAEVEAAK